MLFRRAGCDSVQPQRSKLIQFDDLCQIPTPYPTVPCSSYLGRRPQSSDLPVTAPRQLGAWSLAAKPEPPGAVVTQSTTVKGKVRGGPRFFCFLFFIGLFKVLLFDSPCSSPSAASSPQLQQQENWVVKRQALQPHCLGSNPSTVASSGMFSGKCLDVPSIQWARESVSTNLRCSGHQRYVQAKGSLPGRGDAGSMELLRGFLAHSGGSQWEWCLSGTELARLQTVPGRKARKDPLPFLPSKPNFFPQVNPINSTIWKNTALLSGSCAFWLLFSLWAAPKNMVKVNLTKGAGRAWLCLAPLEVTQIVHGGYRGWESRSFFPLLCPPAYLQILSISVDPLGT